MDGEGLSKWLEKRDIYAWGGDGRLRLSLHLFNDLDDIVKVSKLLYEYIRDKSSDGTWDS